MLDHSFRRDAGSSARPSTRRRVRTLTSFGLTLGALAACGGDISDLTSEVLEDPCQRSADIAMGQTLSGQLASGDCVQSDGALGDRWSLTLGSETTVRIDLVSTTFDPLLELRSQSGLLIAWNDDAGSLNSRIVRDLAAGSYVIVARSYDGNGVGGYQLSVQEGPDCSPLGELALGETVAGTLTSSDCLFEWGGVLDNWTLITTSTVKLRMDLLASNLEGHLLVRDPAGEVLEVGSPSGAAGHASIEMELPAGTWTISPASPLESVNGHYELTVDIAPPCGPGTEIVLGATEDGRIAPDDCLFDGWVPADSFVVALAEETQIQIHAKSPDFHPWVIVRDALGHDVMVAHDEQWNGNARASASLEAGSYALFVIAEPYGPAGDYHLTVNQVVCDPMPIEVGETRDGTLDSGDCARGGGAHQETWSLVVPDETTVRIDLESTAFDAYLILRDDLGEVLAVDDDGGSDVNARIERTLAAGSYEIVASSFATGETGAYTLSVTALEPSPTSVATEEDRDLSSLAVIEADEDPSTLMERLRAGGAVAGPRWPWPFGPAGKGGASRSGPSDIFVVR